MKEPKGRTKKLVAVCDRYGWVCHLCGLPIPKEYKLNAPDAPSLDHLIPRKVTRDRLQGVLPKKEWERHKELIPQDNCRPAHAFCNSRRGHNERTTIGKIQRLFLKKMEQYNR